MSSTTGASPSSADLAAADLTIAFPAVPDPLPQDSEWCVVQVDDEWKQIRFHDYGEIYDIPGLYERLFYEVLQCQSPRIVCDLLGAELKACGVSPRELRVLDLGAGNGMVAEALTRLNVSWFVGIDILAEAKAAAERDRPELYQQYFALDMTRLADEQRERLRRFRFNAMTCVAALGFGDIPPRAFAEGFNLVAENGWLAFTIKEDFLDESDDSGFSLLIRQMIECGNMQVRRQVRYRHRYSIDREPLHYVAIVAGKRKDITRELFKEL